MKMTLYDLLSAIVLASPLFCGIAEGKKHGLVGIVAGLFIGLFFGIIACLAFRTAGYTIISRVFRDEEKRPLLFALVGPLYVLAVLVWGGLFVFATMFVMKAIF
jgi:hypothetical protein